MRGAHHPLVAAFRGQEIAPPTSRTLRTSRVLVTEFKSDHETPVVTGVVPQDDAYIVTLHLRDRPPGEMCAEGRWIRTENFVSGNAGIIDLRTRLLSRYSGAFHYISLYLTRAALHSVADDAGARRIGDLNHQPGVGFNDPTLRHLLLALKPALAAEVQNAATLYADHVATALISHVATTYGGLQIPRRAFRGGLAPWQQRRAKEILEAAIDRGVSLAELAAACNVSIRHFTRAFRQSTGRSPHDWLTERRIDRAKDLLLASTQSLNAIAATCGFANQSHFTRVFAREVGMSPGAWRRVRL
jgi:AraC-like DNA-binding protein